MASKMQFFERDLKLATAGLEPGAINAALAAFAKQELQRVISSGEAPSIYRRSVNDIMGASEESVRVPGQIIYYFTVWPMIINTALRILRQKAPVKSGRYANSFIVIADQTVVRDYNGISGGAEVIIINTQPYTRKMEGGGLYQDEANRKAKGSGYRHFQQTKTALFKEFQDAFAIDFRFLSVGSGLQSGLPYILKRGGRRKDRQAGMPITYPALIINAV